MRRLAALLCSATVVAGCMSSANAQTDTTYESQALSWSQSVGVTDVANTAATNGQTKSVTSASTGSVTVNAPVSSVTVSARGNDCNGYANMQVKVNGAVIANQIVNANYTNYTFPVTATG